MSLTCAKGCGKCCEIGGGGKLIPMNDGEAAMMGRALGRTPGPRVPLRFVSKGAPCPAYDAKTRACTAYDARPAVCRIYQCDGEDQWVKSAESTVKMTALAQMTPTMADIRDWFPETAEQTFARHQGRIAFQFSGGKDSTAALLLLKQYWDRFTVYFCNSGDMLPETVHFVEDFARQLPYFQRIEGRVFTVKARFGIPSDVVPWSSTQTAHELNAGKTVQLQDRVACCYRSIMEPLHQRMQRDGITLIIRGQKTADSLKGPFVSGEVSDGMEAFYPIQDWTDEDCFSYLRAAGVAIPRYYTEGLVHSGDCLGCTAWVAEEDRASYLKKNHPERFPQYRKEIMMIAASVAESGNGLARAVENCLKE